MTIISSPGKVLLAGGYLVLDRNYTGLVTATSSRFYCSVESTSSSSTPEAARITVRAGQFPSSSSTWAYDVIDGEVSSAGETANKFVAITLAQVLRYAKETLGSEQLKERLGSGLEVIVLADNDFYSQREQLAAASLPARYDSLSSLTPFHPLPRGIGETNKTGLGSSAALVTSLVAGILAHLKVTEDEDTVHALAQAAHCLAQGKVGSGFDVASAVYGTHVYRRFSPAILEPVFGGDALKKVVDGQWDHEQRPFRLPRGLRLMLADVDAGTDTPSFVGKVLAWRKEKAEEALGIWTRVDEANRDLETSLRRLAELEGENDYDAVFAKAGSGAKGEGFVGAALQSTQQAIESIRAGMREMSEASGVPIEPEEQTMLLDECSRCPGVIGAGVPGAGGYDAIWVLAVDDDAVVSRVEDVWSSWTEMSVCPLSARQSDGGLQRVEKASEVRGLEEALRRAREGLTA